MISPTRLLPVFRSTAFAAQTEELFDGEVRRPSRLKYLLSLPSDVEDRDERRPLILFLHGAGERGDDLSLARKHGVAKIAETREDFPFIAASPQCPEGAWWTDLVEDLIALLDHLIANHCVDEDRVYLTGLSMGGYGAWALAKAYPDRFAAVAPICGGGHPFAIERMKSVPVWNFHGAKDEVVPLERSQVMVDALKRAGGKARFTVYPDAGHDAWTETYDNPELYEWFLSHRRRSD